MADHTAALNRKEATKPESWEEAKACSYNKTQDLCGVICSVTDYAIVRYKGKTLYKNEILELE